MSKRRKPKAGKAAKGARDPAGRPPAGERPDRARRAREARPAAPLSFAELRVEPGPPVPAGELPSVAVVVLNYNGLHHLDGCFDSLRALDYPTERLSAVLVDNGSSDGSQAHMRERHPWVLLVENQGNLGFSAAANQGASASDAELVVFLNNDMRVEPDWLAELVAPIVRGECGATTAKMLSWDGATIDSAAGGMNFHGIGIQHGYRSAPGPEFDRPRKTLFACGGAMACDRALFLELGGFDEEFFAYYEDVDLGWRAWVQGHEVHYVPSAVCYHHHSSTSRTFPPETVRLLQVRNPLLACVKNYDRENLVRVLPGMLGLYLRRMLLVSGIPDDAPYRIQRAAGGGAARPDPGWIERALARLRGVRSKLAPDRAEVSRVVAADLIGVNDLLGNWSHWMARRAEVQSRRRRADEEIVRLFLKPLWAIEKEPAYGALQDGLTELTGLAELFEGLELIPGEPHGRTHA